MTETDLAGAQRRYQELFDNVLVGLYRSTPGPEGTFQAVNLAMVRICEADSREQLMAVHPSAVYLDPAQRLVTSDATMSEGFFEDDVELLTLKGRSVWCRMTAVKKIDERGEPYFDCAMVDITELRRAAAELAEQVQGLARANAELQQFAYVASHDLQEPLRMIASYLQLIERRYEDVLDAAGREFMAFAVDGATRLQGMINDLLEYSRVQGRGVALETVDCEGPLAQALVNLTFLIEESGAKVTHDPLPEVQADPTQLTQVFQNLIGNAIRFRGEDAPLVHVSAARGDSEWVFSVRDNGIGVDPQYAERIFQVFQRLGGATYPGTGIGLAICKRVVERHKGRM